MVKNTSFITGSPAHSVGGPD